MLQVSGKTVEAFLENFSIRSLIVIKNKIFLNLKTWVNNKLFLKSENGLIALFQSRLVK